MRPAYNELTRLPHLGTRATGNNARLHLGTTGDAHAFKKITYPGINNKSEFTHDPLGRTVKIVETVSGSVTSTKQHIWCSGDRCEERDGGGSPSKQFFARGQINSSTNYFYSEDHLGSVRSMTDDYGNVQASYSFNPFGQPKKLEGAQDSDFQFAGYYLHARSGLSLTVARPYSATLARFLNRDPIEEFGGVNLFVYVNNDPSGSIDPSGLALVPSRVQDPYTGRGRAGDRAQHSPQYCMLPYIRAKLLDPGFPVLPADMQPGDWYSDPDFPYRFRLATPGESSVPAIFIELSSTEGLIRKIP